MKTKVILSVVLGVILINVAGCRATAHGAGEDMEHAGQKIQEKTEK
ncbi:MAG: hypothetical protein JWM04_392 [Verrucomicrobiales bacterium]|jgi:predicted small secreted protein|nr:hypothetical protein [Verrucomicrobiales bacterium]